MYEPGFGRFPWGNRLDQLSGGRTKHHGQRLCQSSQKPGWRGSYRAKTRSCNDSRGEEHRHDAMPQSKALPHPLAGQDCLNDARSDALS